MKIPNVHVTVCPRSSDPFYIVNHYIKWVLILGHTVRKAFSGSRSTEKQNVILSHCSICCILVPRGSVSIKEDILYREQMVLSRRLRVLPSSNIYLSNISLSVSFPSHLLSTVSIYHSLFYHNLTGQFVWRANATSYPYSLFSLV